MKIMKMKLTNYLKTGILFFGISLLFWNCEKNEILEELNLQESELKTVPIENSMSFFKTINNNTLSKSVAKENNDIGLKIDIESLEQVALTNTDAKLTIANASTKIENIETQILQIEIDGEIQTVLFHHVPENNTAERTTSNRSSSSFFSGSVYTTNLSGMVLSGFKINNGNVLGSFNIFAGSYSTDPTDPICYTCGIQQLDEILILGNPSHYAASGHTTMDDRQYQWSRSSNNYSYMGIAYARHYRFMAIKDFDDKINDTSLKPCLKNIIKDLKKVWSSPGNMVAKFSGNSPYYNWEVKSGSLNGGTGQTESPSSYNPTNASITTTFDSQAWKNATNLSWARTILHEAIHAYLASYYNINRPNWIATYPEMVEDWGVLQNWNGVHHEEFSRNLVIPIAVALESYGINKGYNLSKQFYEDMAWAGLQDTAAFKALPSSVQKRILDTIATELTGKDIDENTKEQKGENAGC
jgi:hypothetical protein